MQLSEAEQIISKAQAKARELKVNVSIWVLDAAANPVAFARMDGVGLMTPEIARRKAYTAVMMRRNTNEWAEGMKGRTEVLMSIMQATGGMIIALGGGVVIKRGDEVVGSVGVSGATAEQDHDCAVAGSSA